MNLADTKICVENIRLIAGDDEAAHSGEDALMVAFIEEVAESGNKRLKEMAKVVLSTRDIRFCRWCA